MTSVIQNSKGLIQSSIWSVSLRSKILENRSNKGDPSLQLQKGAELLIQKGGRRRRARRKDKSVALNFLSFADLTGKKRQRIRTRWEIEHYEIMEKRSVKAWRYAFWLSSLNSKKNFSRDAVFFARFSDSLFCQVFFQGYTVHQFYTKLWKEVFDRNFEFFVPSFPFHILPLKMIYASDWIKNAYIHWAQHQMLLLLSFVFSLVYL